MLHFSPSLPPPPLSLPLSFSLPPSFKDDIYTHIYQMVSRLKQQLSDLKDELSIATGVERTDELTDEEKAKCVVETSGPK